MGQILGWAVAHPAHPLDPPMALWLPHTHKGEIYRIFVRHCCIIIHPKKRMFAHAQGFYNMAKLILKIDCLALHVMYVVNSPTPWIWELLELFIMRFWNS